MNRQDFIKSNNEIDYVAYASYLESSLLQKDENLKKAIQSNINFQKHSSELEGENVLLKEENEQLKEQLKKEKKTSGIK